MHTSRRDFLRSVAAAGAGLAVSSCAASAAQRKPPGDVVDPGRPPRRRALSEAFADLPRHFVFEYYPWYAVDPYVHWNEAGRVPPVDLASNYMPALGAYDSRSTAIMERHARWIRDSGAGAINVSWWGRDSDIDRLIPSLMDVMAAHDVHVAFHLEPYGDGRSAAYADDIQYLITQYGDRRHWDCFLLPQDEQGRSGPVFKSFATILPTTSTDCHGNTSAVGGYTPDSGWRQQTDRVRQTFRNGFDRITLLADSLDVTRTAAAGFDGIAIYDNNVVPSSWPGWAETFSARNLLYSFNVNPGFDGIALRQVDPGSCYSPPKFQPGGVAYDWTRAADREAAAAASAARIRDALHTTIDVQRDPRLADARAGFFLTYINSFNEWHEGHAFEPMKNDADLTAAERAVGYHNPANGSYRLQLLTDLLGDLL